jgi:ATP synthase protein I
MAEQPTPERRLEEQVARRARRRARALREQRRTVWFSLGLFGMIGWSIAVPALVGVALGLWLDRHAQGRVSWTITLLLAGVAVGCLNAWRWLQQESSEEDDRD